MSRLIWATAALAAIVVGQAQDNDARNLIQSAEQAIRRAQFAEADTLYAKAAALGDQPAIAPALLYLGVRALGQGNRLAAEGFFQRVVKVDPRGPQAGPALSWLATMRTPPLKATSVLAVLLPGDAAEAEDLFKQALAVENPQSVDAVDTMRKYAVFLRSQGRPEEATEMENRAGEAQRAGTTSRFTIQPSALGAGVFRVGGGVSAPKLLKKTEPEYTEGARKGKIQGVVILGVDISPDGSAGNFEVIRSLEPGLDQKAIDAVQQWRFQPGKKDGSPVTVRATIEVNFRLM
jgi:TonB family protein